MRKSHDRYWMCRRSVWVVSGLNFAFRELTIGERAVVLPEEAIATDQDDCLVRWLAHQPPWSDLPVLILARRGRFGIRRPGDGSTRQCHRARAPMRVAALVSAVRCAVARRRQYQIRDYVIDQERSKQVDALLAAIVASSDDAIISKTLEETFFPGTLRPSGFSATPPRKSSANRSRS